MWNENQAFWSPMISIDEEHIYLGDIVYSKSTCSNWQYGKVAKFVEVS